MRLCFLLLLVGEAVTAAKDHFSSVDQCCTALSRQLPGKVAFPNGTSYQSSIQSYFTQQEQALHPSCIVTPATPQDVSVAVAFLSKANAKNTKTCPFAVKSGGHGIFAGVANIEGGITIDLFQLNSVITSPDKSRVKIGVGNKWGNVYHQLENEGLATTGGRLSGIGVGGLVSGGGVSFYSRESGLVCDTALNFEIVLAGGTIVNANKTSHPALFRALKGGSNNFGVITSIDLPAFRTGPIWGGFYATPITYRPQIFSYFVNFTNSSNYDPYAALLPTNLFTNNTWIEFFHLAYTKQPATPNPETFAPILEIPPLFSTLRTATLSELTDEFEAGAPVAPRAHYDTFTHKNDIAFMEAFFDIVNQTAQSLTSVKGASIALTWQPWSRKMLEIGQQNGKNVLGLEDPADGDLADVDFNIYWANAKDDALVYAATRKMMEDGVALAKKTGVWHKYIYLNYAAEWQKVIASYGKENVKFMKKVSREVDPNGIFQHAVPGGFKIPGL